MLNTSPQLGSKIDGSVPPDRRALGIYYTPDRISAVLCEWAVRKASDRILEPSFGGCVFLVQAAAVLRVRGSHRPFSQLYGCDVDKSAFIHLQSAFPKRSFESRFIRGDFLSIEPGDRFVSGVDAVVGNPPYISNHNMAEAQRASARRSAAVGLLDVRGTASLWAHFLNHSLSFLHDAGRVAMVLPGTAFRTDYGKEILSQLCRRFSRVDIVQLQERVFAEQGVQDMPSILLCDGWNEARGRGTALVHSATTMEECARRILDLRHLKAQSEVENDARFDAAMSVFRRMGQYSLGDLATIRIGIVTGANHFFALRPADCSAFGLSKEMTLPFLSQISMTSSLDVTRRDVRSALYRNDRCLLLSPPEGVKSGSVQAYLRSFPESDRVKNRTFNKRQYWYRPICGEIPDAFLSYMNARFARVVLNSARIQSLNNIHRLYFRDRTTRLQFKLTALAIISTPGQLAAEMLGRSYSGGVLKLEPSDAARMPIPGYARGQAHEVERAWVRINRLLRGGAYDSAVAVADAIVAICSPSIRDDLEMSRDLLHKLRNERLSGRGA